MRTRLFRIIGVSVVLAVCAPPVTGAQPVVTPKRTVADVSGTVGWFNLRDADPERRYDNWANKMADLSGGAGWYWTDNLKTQVDFGVTNKTDRYSYEQLFINGRQTYAPFETTLSSRHLAIAQHYQFFRNQWFHPRVGAGVDVAWERTLTEIQPAAFFDPVLRQTIQLRPGRTEGPETRTIARPFVEVGYKAYMTRRSFFTNDLRLGVRHGVDNVILRFGFGVDF